MNTKSLLAPVCISAAALAAVAGFALAEPAKKSTTSDGKITTGKPADSMKMPEGMDPYMQACMEAAIPGEMHEWLMKGAGTWNGENTMWMEPGAEPMKTTSKSVCTTMLDERFLQCEMSGEMPGMGMFNGFCIVGFDNASQKFQCSWVDNCGTGQMWGTGELSSDKKTMNWTYTYNCPFAKKPVTMREVEHFHSADSKTMEMFMNDPKTGKEFKMLEIKFTRAK